jgi:hypothetical protein
MPLPPFGVPRGCEGPELPLPHPIASAATSDARIENLEGFAPLD